MQDALYQYTHCSKISIYDYVLVSIGSYHPENYTLTFIGGGVAS